MPSPSLLDYARSEDEAFAEPFDGGSTGSADDDETEDPVEEEVAEPATLAVPPIPDSVEASASATQAAQSDSAQPVREGSDPEDSMQVPARAIAEGTPPPHSEGLSEKLVGTTFGPGQAPSSTGSDLPLYKLADSFRSADVLPPTPSGLGGPQGFSNRGSSVSAPTSPSVSFRPIVFPGVETVPESRRAP
ncbi:hypothetical protein KEM55_001685 [Ascosphaera atra]|nr:hypothetical protein KEM55_001685 [Ascosphaera atra]